MKSYKGIIRIRCDKKMCKLVAGFNVAPGCMACPDAVIGILGLNGEVLFEARMTDQCPTLPYDEAPKKRRKR